MLNSIIGWWQRLNRVMDTYDKDIVSCVAKIAECKYRITELELRIKDMTVHHCDIAHHSKGKSYAIMIGRVNNSDYVQTFEIPGHDFSSIVNELKRMERMSNLGRFDGPPMIKSFLEREFF